MSEKEIGRLTHIQYLNRKKEYEDKFDIELMLTIAKKTYRQYYEEIENDSKTNDMNFVNKYL